MQQTEVPAACWATCTYMCDSLAGQSDVGLQYMIIEST